MVKLRFTNLNAELDGDPKDIASILRELNVVSQTPNAIIQPPKTTPPKDSTSNPALSIDELFQKLPDRSALTGMIEALGKPFSFNLVEQQMKFFGRIIKSRDSRDNQRLYSRFYDLHTHARNSIVEKYGGHWTMIAEVINGHKTTRYTWGESEGESEETQPITQTILPSEGFEMEHDISGAEINQE